ncbi:TPA: hypothetical protein DDZ86_04905 [Candidatus Dependentiae bacterium]|nr:MAG: hypothetical protein A2Y17_09710 [Clostridiales bacterium GWF2_38_85]HBL98950.1 hypothetical protein [Candidatus Dependentiae bacterium]
MKKVTRSWALVLAALAPYTLALGGEIDNLAGALKNIAETKVEETKQPETPALTTTTDIETGTPLVRRVRIGKDDKECNEASFIKKSQEPFETEVFKKKIEIYAPTFDRAAINKIKSVLPAPVKTVWDVTNKNERKKLVELLDEVSKINTANHKDFVENVLKFIGRFDPTLLIEINNKFGFTGDEKEPLKVKCGDLELFLRVVKHIFECAIERVEDYELQIKKKTKLEGLRHDIEAIQPIRNSLKPIVLKLRKLSSTNPTVAGFLANWDALVARWGKLWKDNETVLVNELGKEGFLVELVVDETEIDPRRRWCHEQDPDGKGVWGGYKFNKKCEETSFASERRDCRITRKFDPTLKANVLFEQKGAPSADKKNSYFKPIKYDIQEILDAVAKFNMEVGTEKKRDPAVFIIKKLNELVENVLDQTDIVCPICFDAAFDEKYKIVEKGTTKEVDSEEAFKQISDAVEEIANLWTDNPIVEKALHAAKTLESMRNFRLQALAAWGDGIHKNTPTMDYVLDKWERVDVHHTVECRVYFDGSNEEKRKLYTSGSYYYRFINASSDWWEKT